MNPDNPYALAILAMIHMNPHISLREIERDLGTTKHCSKDLPSNRYHPYHITLTQALSAMDRQNRVAFCHWAEIERKSGFFSKRIFQR